LTKWHPSLLRPENITVLEFDWGGSVGIGVWATDNNGTPHRHAVKVPRGLKDITVKDVLDAKHMLNEWLWNKAPNAH
jgi:hypothetical protein